MADEWFRTPEDLLRQQREQFAHDRRNHSDIICLPRTERLKHYGLHFAKYAGRIARGGAETKALSQTLVDAALVCLAAANALNQKLDCDFPVAGPNTVGSDPERFLTDAAGRFADACEKIDHLEEFIAMARNANVDVLRWVVSESRRTNLDLEEGIRARRAELGQRVFYAS